MPRVLLDVARVPGGSGAPGGVPETAPYRLACLPVSLAPRSCREYPGGVARRRGGRLTARRRRSIPKSKFALPGKRKFPVDTRKRAANAKARATQQMNRGKISRSTRDKVHAAANRRLRRR